MKEDIVQKILLSMLIVLGMSVQNSGAREIAGVMVQESIQSENGVELLLNGAGIRSKFFFDIYIAELYLEQSAATAAEVIAGGGVKRIVMHFLYDEVGRDKLIAGWDEGFVENTTADKLKAIEERTIAFNELFVDVKKGDQIVLEFTPEAGTSVMIAGEKKGVIPGKDFNDALLSIWLGEKPVTKKLKGKLLGK